MERYSKGSSLLEVLLATSLFLILVIYGYQSLEHQNRLSKAIVARTRSEKENNYRLLLLKHSIEQSARRLQGSKMLEQVPIFFPNLDLTGTADKNAFSVAVPVTTGANFEKQGPSYAIAPAIPLEPETICIFGGVDANREFCWNYGRVSSVQQTQSGAVVSVSFFFPCEPLAGLLAPVTLKRFLFDQNVLYQVSANGAREPFFDPVEEFRYRWNPPQLTISWKRGTTECEFTTNL